ncbi:MAG TPA: ATP-binding protein [Dissulfurispiraceae bacterium]|nr:ATP-binding protein [Dissulfurispiraceae bacterium]
MTPGGVEVGLDCHPGRGLDRGVVLRLAACDWIRQGHQVLISGPTGAGKTFFACAIGNAACRQGISTRYYRVPRLLQDLALARADGSYAKLLARLAGTKLLILDDWGITPLSTGDCREVFELVDDRSSGRSTVVASQLPLDAWHAAMADPSLADAILDRRLVHGAYKIVLKGESMRKAMRNNPSNPPDMTGTTPGVATSRPPHAQVIDLGGMTDRLRPDRVIDFAGIRN